MDGTKRKHNFKDLTGQKFGRLAVISVNGSDKCKKILWLCKCECGNTKIIRADNLTTGRTRSCGCLVGEFNIEQFSLPEGEAAFNQLYLTYINSAKRRGYPFELNKEHFRALVTNNCSFCNRPPKQVNKTKSSSFVYNGIDREDNSKGYVKGNVYTCCKFCNYAKGTQTMRQFRNTMVCWVNNHPHFLGAEELPEDV
jgi:hypothetical protein